MTPINDNKSVNSPLTKKAAKQTLKSKIKDDKVKKTKKVDEENAPEAKGKKNIKVTNCMDIAMLTPFLQFCSIFRYRYRYKDS